MAARRRLDALVAAGARLLLTLFYRRVEVVGAAHLPRDRPLVLVANHTNALVDPMVILGALPVTPRFLGKSTLWRNPLLRPLLALAGIIPVYRRQDPGVDTARNVETFARCHRELAEGGTIALFPEGLSHSEPTLAPLRTGAARIVLEAEAQHGPLGSRVVPVGLHFDAKERFRSRVLLQVGEALDPALEGEAYGDDPVEAVRRLTGRIQEALAAVTVEYPSWEEARLIARAAELFERPSLAAPGERPLAQRAALHRAFAAGYRDLAERAPERVAAAASAVGAYDRLLAALRLRDDQVAARYEAGAVRRFLVKSLAFLILGLPVAAVGALLNWVPYRLAGVLAGLIARAPHTAATYKLFPSLLLFPTVWTAEALAAARLAGGWGALAAALAGPLTGWVALAYNDRRATLWREARAFLLLRTRRRLAEELRQRRHRAYREVMEVAEGYTDSR